MALQLKEEVLFVHCFNLISLKGMSLASSKHGLREGKWPESCLKIERKIWLEKMSDDKLIRLAKMWWLRSLVEMQTISDQETIGFFCLLERDRGEDEYVLLWHTAQQRWAAAQRSQSAEKKPWWIRMELRLPEPGAGNSAQSSEQKALQEERLRKEMLVAGE